MALSIKPINMAQETRAVKTCPIKLKIETGKAVPPGAVMNDATQRILEAVQSGDTIKVTGYFSLFYQGLSYRFFLDSMSYDGEMIDMTYRLGFEG